MRRKKSTFELGPLWFQNSYTTKFQNYTFLNFAEHFWRYHTFIYYDDFYNWLVTNFLVLSNYKYELYNTFTNYYIYLRFVGNYQLHSIDWTLGSVMSIFAKKNHHLFIEKKIRSLIGRLQSKWPQKDLKQGFFKPFSSILHIYYRAQVNVLFIWTIIQISKYYCTCTHNLF